MGANVKIGSFVFAAKIFMKTKKDRGIPQSFFAQINLISVGFQTCRFFREFVLFENAAELLEHLVEKFFVFYGKKFGGLLVVARKFEDYEVVLLYTFYLFGGFECRVILALIFYRAHKIKFEFFSVICGEFNNIFLAAAIAFAVAIVFTATVAAMAVRIFFAATAGAVLLFFFAHDNSPFNFRLFKSLRNPCKIAAAARLSTNPLRSFLLLP